MVDQQDNGMITQKKIQSSIAGYIWDSPCLKPIVYNPFLIAALVTLMLCTIDFLYGKTFIDKNHTNKIGKIVQHSIVAYVLIVAAIVSNNMLIKYKYRLKRFNDKEKENENETNVDGKLTSIYID